MAMGPRLDLRQSQSLVMTPQLQQAIKLLALSNLEIETFIGEALESNPLLEAGEVSRENGEADDGPEAPREETSSDTLMAEGHGEVDRPLDIAAETLDRDRDTGDGEWGSGGSQSLGAEGPSIDERGSGAISLADHLNAQVGPVAGDAREEFLARYLIGQIDDAGYLTMNEHEVALELGVPVPEVERALAVIHSLEPAGVGARNLAECLALQAREADRYDPCMARLIDNLDLIAKGAFEQLRRMCDVDDEDFADMLAELRTYDPRPGLQFGSSEGTAVVPDVLIEHDQSGGWRISLNEATLPRLVVNRNYYLELRQGSADKESRAWLQERLGDANWLIKALDQRQKTILKVSAEIVKQQDGFFRRGVSDLRPLTLRTVAEAIEMHESTVSRVTSNKYLHCDRGTFELKYFFTSGVGADADGEGGASSQAVKARIKGLTDAEDPKKILSDDKLVELLKDEGFDLARRTVAKYREAIRLYLEPVLSKKPLPKITRADIVSVLDAMPTEQVANQRNVFAVMRRLFRWAVSRGDIERSPMEGMETPPPVKPRDRWLKDRELRLVWHAAPQCHPCFGPIVRLLIVTGQRREEVSGIHWQEVDRKDQFWTLPGSRTKNNEPNAIPLNELAVAELDRQAGGANWPKKGRVFATSSGAGFTGYSKGKKNLDGLIEKNLGEPLALWRLHDLRRTLATNFQRLGVRFEVTEAVLNHVSGSRAGVAGIYQRHDWKDEKRKALNDWNEYLVKILNDPEQV